MEELIIALLGGAIIYLWNRTSDLQRQIERLWEMLDAAPVRTTASTAQYSTSAKPASRAADIPQTAADVRTASPAIRQQPALV